MDERIFTANLCRMQRLAERLEQALDQLRQDFPLQTDTFDPALLDPKLALFLDGFRARFADLQDLIGRTLFKSIALMDQDEAPGNELSTRERTVLMEKRGLIDARQWQELREIRNGFAHEYPDAPDEIAANLNAAWAHSKHLIGVAAAITRYAATHYGVPPEQ